MSEALVKLSFREKFAFSNTNSIVSTKTRCTKASTHRFPFALLEVLIGFILIMVVITLFLQSVTGAMNTQSRVRQSFITDVRSDAAFCALIKALHCSEPSIPFDQLQSAAKDTQGSFPLPYADPFTQNGEAPATVNYTIYRRSKTDTPLCIVIRFSIVLDQNGKKHSSLPVTFYFEKGGKNASQPGTTAI